LLICVSFVFTDKICINIILPHELRKKNTREYALHYVDDLVVFSKTFEEHLEHLDTVLRKLTTAGFTINLIKCNFCKPEIKFFRT